MRAFKLTESVEKNLYRKSKMDFLKTNVRMVNGMDQHSSKTCGKIFPGPEIRGGKL